MTVAQSTPEEAHKFFTSKMTFTTGPMEVFEMIEKHEPVNIVDVRAAKDYVKAHVPGAISLPQEEWSLTNALDKKKVNILYCYSHVCHLAAKAAVEFSNRGYRVMEMEGGFKEWEAYNLPVQSQAVEAPTVEESSSEPERGSVSMVKDTQRTLH